MRRTLRRWNRRPLLSSLLSVVALASLLSACQSATSNEKPTILLIVTDDQRWDTLWAMPLVRRELAAKGVTFTNAYVTDPLCCPSRASILTGAYAHTTGVWQNTGPLGGFKRFRDRSTVATWLHAAGYHTGLFGKYLNRYRGTYVPPGWDRWAAIGEATDPYDLYYRYWLNIDGRLRRFGTEPKDYSTNVLASEAVRFILRTSGPLFVYFTPYAPHYPFKPAPGDASGFSHTNFPEPPSYNERDVSDKPKWVQGRHRFPPTLTARIAKRHRRAAASLIAVDRAVGALLEALRVTDRLNRSMIIFTSDNGILEGEHRWLSKAAPYEESIRVPLVIRYGEVAQRRRQDSHLVLNIDLAPTLAAVAGSSAPAVEGRSLMPLLNGSSVAWRKDFLLEYSHADVLPIPGYCGVHSERFSYVRYATGEEELYDLRHDPFQLLNLARRRGAQPLIRSMRVRLRELCPHPPPDASRGGGTD
jgi:N-acetylglucosamine-6-sulfatase